MGKLERIAGAALTLFLAGALPSWAKPNHAVVGYSASWFDATYPPESYNYGVLTHINRSFLRPKPDGDIVTEDNFWNPDLEKLAHAHGVKLMASIGGASDTADHWMSMAGNPAYEKRFLDQLEKLITSHHYDGVDIDWEPSAQTDAEQAAYTRFMRDLRERFPKWIITTALGGGEYWAKHISWSEIAAQVDFINLMLYDFAGNWAGTATHDSSLYASKNPGWDGGLSDDEVVTRLENKYGLAADKITLGVPFYGVQFFVKHMGDPFSKDTKGQGTQLQYYELYPLTLGKAYSVQWDNGAQVPYMERIGGSHVITYEDPKSIGLKCQYASDKNLRGVMIWNLGADVIGGRTPLLDAIARSFGAQPLAMPPEGLAKTFQSFAALVKESYAKLSDAYQKLLAGKSSAAQAANPGPQPDLAAPDIQDAETLGKRVWQLQYQLSVYNTKLQDSQAPLNALPIPKGAKLSAGGGSLLVDDFESGAMENRLKGVWMTEADHNNLGTVLNPSPFKSTPGGNPDSPKFAARIWGHYGKSQAPWPTATLVGTLSPEGKAVDLSGFSAVRFWAKGDGKSYTVILGKASVQDSAHFRGDFKTSAGWTRVTLNFSDFKQPEWGRQVPLNFSDTRYIAFSPTSKFNDENLDLWVDDVTLVK